MSAWDIYWVMNFHALGAVLGLSGAGLLVYAIVLAGWTRDQAPVEDEARYYRRAKIAALFGTILFVVGLAWPDQKTYVAMYFGPKLVGYLSTNDVSDEAKECLRIMKRVLLQEDERE